jgi:hypothetical protein
MIQKFDASNLLIRVKLKIKNKNCPRLHTFGSLAVFQFLRSGLEDP